MFDMFGGGSPDQCQEGNWEGHKYGALFRAVAEGDEYTLRSLFREPRYKNRGDIVDGDKCGLLVTLACKPNVVRDKKHAKEIIRIILDNGGDIDQRNSVQETALGFAAHYNHMKIIAALVECGAKVNVTDWKGTTPVAACKKGSIMGNEDKDEQKRCLAYLEECAAKELKESGALTKANQGRQRGNNFYMKGKYEQAIAAYKQSLSDYEDHRTYGNLAAAELKLANRNGLSALLGHPARWHSCWLVGRTPAPRWLRRTRPSVFVYIPIKLVLQLDRSSFELCMSTSVVVMYAYSPVSQGAHHCVV